VRGGGGAKYHAEAGTGTPSEIIPRAGMGMGETLPGGGGGDGDREAIPGGGISHFRS